MRTSTNAEVQWLLPADGGPNVYSPAIESVCKGCGVAMVVTPFFTPAQLLQLLSQAGRNATCLTDVDFLDQNMVGATQVELAKFRQLATNGHLRSISPLHSKILLKGDRAIVGSANVTTSGLGRNIETGVLLRGSVVEPLRLWIEELRNKSLAIPPARVRLTEEARRARIEGKVPRSRPNWRVAPFPSPAPAHAGGWETLAARLNLDESTAQQVRALLAHAIDGLGIDEGRDSSVAFNWRTTDKRASLSVGAALVLRLGRTSDGWDVELCALQEAAPIDPFERWFDFGGKRAGITTWKGICADLRLSRSVLAEWSKGLRRMAIIEGGAKSRHNKRGWESMKGPWIFRL
jgi:hypothetical protein